MSKYFDAIARVQLEAEFGNHTHEVLDSGSMPNMPQLQLRLQEHQYTAPQGGGWRPEFGEPEDYLESVYNCILQ